jgi:quinohemoprotein ethanol dehydrogenase
MELPPANSPRRGALLLRIILAGAICILLASAFWSVSSPPQAHAQTGPVAAANLDWPSYGGDLGNSRFLNADQINPTNVAGLKPAWVFHTGVLDPKASLEVSPVIVGGTMYVTSGHDDLFALDAATGAVKWAYHPLSEMPTFDEIKLCCGRANRGVAFGNGKVFLARFDDVVVALEAGTGKVVWKTPVVDYHNAFSMTMAPQFVNGLVIVGVSGGEFKVRGQVVALNADTGQEVWRFFTTLPGATWAGNSWQQGGATVWQTPAADPALGLIYINTGNAAPDLNGSQRAGDNLYTCSIVALDMNTGTVRWHFQEVHHDLWDYDSAQPPLLFTLAKNGQEFPALGHGSKNGNYYILDRRTGEPLYPVTEMPVSTEPAWQHPSPTQPVSSVEPLTPMSIQSLPKDLIPAIQYTPPREQKVVIQPGDDGGVEWPSGAFSPRTRFVYYGTRYEPTFFESSPNSTNELGSAFEEMVPGVKASGIFGATDTTTGKVAWKVPVDQPAKSGLLVAGDLLFFGEGNGKFHAVNAATGAILWSFDGTSMAGGGGANAEPVAYVVNGREFIVNAFGGNVPDAEHFPPNPVGDAIIAFALP